METANRTRKPIEVLPAGTISGTRILKTSHFVTPIESYNENDLKKATIEPDQLKKARKPRRSTATKVIDGMKYRTRKPARRSTKGLKKTSDYIEYDKALLKGRELLWNDKQMITGFFVIFSINTGLRVSDTLRLKHSDLANLKPGDLLTIQEHKTKKTRKIQINDKINEAYSYLSGKLQDRGEYQENDYVFKSQKNTVFATISLNRILKQIFAGYAPNISTHSLRKSFGRRVYDTHRQSEHSLTMLSDLFNHSNLSITRRYLGLRQEEFNNIYMNL